MVPGFVKFGFVINYITGKNNEITDNLSKQEQNVPKTGDDRLEYKMAKFLKPGILNDGPSIMLQNFMLVQLVATGENWVRFQPIVIEKPDIELEICRPCPKTMTTFTNRWWTKSKKENEHYFRLCLPKKLSVIDR